MESTGTTYTTSLDTRHPRQRLAALLDAGSIAPLCESDDSGVATVRGRIHGSNVVVYCTDPARSGGAMGVVGCRHIVEAIETALHEGCPVIGLWHSAGARLTEGVEALHAVGEVFHAMVMASGLIPQLSVVLGAAAGGAAYGPALTDVVVMAPEGRVFVTGPDVIRAVTGEEIDQAALGGAEAHGERSGVVHVMATDEADAYCQARSLTSILAHHGAFDPRTVMAGNDLRALLPESSRRAYDVRPVVREILDVGSPIELQADWAPNMVTTLGRLGQRSVGVLANNPLRKGGCLDSLSAEKAARFVRMCDSFGVPLLVLVDVPGYLPGIDQEWGGVVRRGAKLLHAFAEAVVPRVTLLMRKAYGGAYIAMNCRALGASSVFAWPEAEVAVMGAKAAVGILYRKQLAAAPDGERGALHARLVAEQERVAGGIERAVSLGVVDKVIEPSDTRQILAHALANAPAGRGRHGNIPL